MALVAAVAAANQALAVARSVSLHVTRTAGLSSLAGYPRAFVATASLTRADSGAVLCSANTLVFVKRP